MEDENKKKNNKLQLNEAEKQSLMKVLGKNMSDTVFNKMSMLEKEGGLQFPKNYSVANALRSAWLMIQTVKDKNKKPALSVCTKDSVANALMDMVIQGLSPVKKQCYFVVFGDVLTLMRSYMGTMAVTKRIANIKEIFTEVIYEGDKFEYEINPLTGLKKVITHTQSLNNIDLKKIIGAYAVILRHGEEPYTEIMTIDQIRKAWNMGNANGNSDAHKNFTDQMCKKTVANRGCKTFFNTSDDSDLLLDAVNRTTSNEYLTDADYEEVVENEIEEKANKELLDVHMPDDEKNKEEKNSESEFQTEVDWESPKSIINKINSIRTPIELEAFENKLDKHMDSFMDSDIQIIENSLDERKKQIERGF